MNLVHGSGILGGTEYESPRAALTAEGMTQEGLVPMSLDSTPSPSDRTYPHSKRIRIDDSILNPCVPREFIERWNFDPADSFNLNPIVSLPWAYNDQWPLAPVVFRQFTHEEIQELLSATDTLHKCFEAIRCPFCGAAHVIDFLFGTSACPRTQQTFWQVPVSCVPNDRELLKYFPDCAPKPKPKPAELINSGGVYLIKANSRYKIGISNNIRKRVRNIATSSPFPIEVVHTEPTDDYVDLERYVHRQLSQFRVHLEWFEFPDELIPAVIDIIKGGAK